MVPPLDDRPRGGDRPHGGGRADPRLSPVIDTDTATTALSVSVSPSAVSLARGMRRRAGRPEPGPAVRGLGERHRPPVPPPAAAGGRSAPTGRRAAPSGSDAGERMRFAPVGSTPSRAVPAGPDRAGTAGSDLVTAGWPAPDRFGPAASDPAASDPAAASSGASGFGRGAPDRSGSRGVAPQVDQGCPSDDRASAGSGESPGRARLGITPLGWGMCVTVAVLLLGARVLRYAELAVLGGAGAAAMGLAAATAVRRPRVSVAVRVSPRQVTRGEPATLSVTVRNLSRWPSPPFTLHLPHGPAAARPDRSVPGAPRVGRLLAASDLVEAWWERRAPAVGGSGSGHRAAAGAADSYPPDGLDSPGAVVSVSVPRLAGSGHRTFELALDTSRRGVVRLGPVEVIRSDPFGLARRRQRLPAVDTLHVRPRTRPLASLACAPSRDPDGQTGRGSTGGLEIHTLRRYAPGEDLRLVHWASSARAGELMVRTHVDPSEPAATVVLDTRPAAYPPGRVGVATFEEAVDIAAAAVMTCTQEAFGVRLVTTGGLRVAGRRRRRDADVLMDELAGVQAGRHRLARCRRDAAARRARHAGARHRRFRPAVAGRTRRGGPCVRARRPGPGGPPQSGRRPGRRPARLLRPGPPAGRVARPGGGDRRPGRHRSHQRYTS